MLELQFLGTSAGMPSQYRNVTGLVARLGNTSASILFDCGEGSQKQIMHSFTSLAKIKHIFISHMHGDHIFGLPGLLGSRSLLGCRAAISIVGPIGIQKFVEASLKASYTQLCFEVQYQELPILEPGKSTPITTTDVAGLESFAVSAIGLVHCIPSYAFQFIELEPKRKFLVEKAESFGIKGGVQLGTLIKNGELQLEDGKVHYHEEFLDEPSSPLNFIVSGDNADPKMLESYLCNSRLLVHESSFRDKTTLKPSQLKDHSCFEDVVELLKPGQVENLIVTHFSSRYHNELAYSKDSFLGLITEEQKKLVHFANDLSRYKLELNNKTWKLEPYAEL